MHHTRMGTSSDCQQLYSLTWSEFSTSMVASLQSLRGHADFVDVTLAAGGRSFPAHKIILSAASPFLLDILKSTPCKHPVVFMAGVAAADLEALLEFVYRGEVSIDPAQLPSLLQAATCLNIQGLVPNIPHTAKPTADKAATPLAKGEVSRDIITSFLPVRRRKRMKRRDSPGAGGKWSRSDNDNENDNTAEQTTATVASTDETTAEQEGGKVDGAEDDPNADDLAGGVSKAELMALKARAASEQPGICPECGAILRQARNLRRHLATGCKNRADVDSDKDSDVYLDPKTVAECHYHDENSATNSQQHAAVATVAKSHQGITSLAKSPHVEIVTKPLQQNTVNVSNTVAKPHHNVGTVAKTHHQLNSVSVAKPHHHDSGNIVKAHQHTAASVAKSHPYYTESVSKHYLDTSNANKPHQYDTGNTVKHYSEPSGIAKPQYQDLSSSSAKLHYVDDNRIAKHHYHEPNVGLPHFLDESNRLMLHYYGMNSVGKPQYMDPNSGVKPHYTDENNSHMSHFSDNMSPQ